MRRALLAAAFLSVASCKRAPEPAAPVLPCAGAAVTKGPWVQRPTETGATLTWESKDASCVEAGLTDEAGGEEKIVAGGAQPVSVTVGYGHDLAEVKQRDEPGTYQMNEVRFDGLAPGHCYRYRLTATPEISGRFCTAKPAGQPFSFVALGDSAVRWKDAQKIAALISAEKADFVVHGGDIQYYASLLETWQEWFGEMEPLLRSGAFMPCIGNHEDEIEGEVENYYLRLFKNPGETATPRWYRYQSGGVHFFSVDTESSVEPGSEQMTWLESELSAVKAKPGFRFSVVYFHKPIYTLARHGPALAARAVLEPLFKAHGVKLVIQAHNHVYERFERDGIVYLVTGGGGAPLYDVDQAVGSFPDDVPFRKAAAKAHHFVRVDVQASGASGRAVAIDGGVIDSFELP